MKLDNGRTKLKIAVVYMPQEKDIKVEDLQKYITQWRKM